MFPLFRYLEVHDCGDSVKAYACKLSDRRLFESEKLKHKFIQARIDPDACPEMSDAIIFCGSDVEKLPPIPAVYMWIRGSGLGSIETWIEMDNDPIVFDCIAYIGQTQNLQERMMETPKPLRKLGFSGEFGHSFLFNYFPIRSPKLFYDTAIFDSEYDFTINENLREDNFHYDYFALAFKPWWGELEDLKTFEKRMIRKYTPYGNVVDNPWCTKKAKELLEQLSEMRKNSNVASKYHPSSFIGGEVCIESFLWSKFTVELQSEVKFRRSLNLDSSWLESGGLTSRELRTLEKYLSLFEELNQHKQQGESNGHQIAAIGRFDFGFSN